MWLFIWVMCSLFGYGVMWFGLRWEVVVRVVVRWWLRFVRGLRVFFDVCFWSWVRSMMLLIMWSGLIFFFFERCLCYVCLLLCSIFILVIMV